MVTVYSVTFFVRDSILLLLVVVQIVKTSHPLQRKVSLHIPARKQLTSFGIKIQNNGEIFLPEVCLQVDLSSTWEGQDTLLVRNQW